MQTPDLFDEPGQITLHTLAPGATLLRGFALASAETLYTSIQSMLARAPLRTMHTPGGRPMSVNTSNCGDFGWISDARGYRYAACDPLSSQPWPDMPDPLRQLATNAAQAAGYPHFESNACLINRYEVGARMGLHQDRDEADLTQPIVSVSLGLSALFLFGGLSRTSPTRKVPLDHGDVVVWGGPSRLAFHGIQPLAAGHHPLTGPYRFNLTFRYTAYAFGTSR
ncbi:DNA oxidative demethylase AlkB [Burkholderiaceae bacterium DAT-1]|nr:DNA oxidative demethylase AlkB [Burkholderiaceae bacterium DAT-1]